MKAQSSLFLLAALTFQSSLASYCWKAGYHREVAENTMFCPEGFEMDTFDGSNFCHQKCKEGYENGAGTESENYCYQKCPKGWDSTGLDYCIKPNDYERIEYYIYSSCLQDNPQGCQSIGFSYFPNCDPLYTPKGAYCTPSCPEGMSDVRKGCCSRKAIQRFKQPPSYGCKDTNSLAFESKCYEQCEKGFIASETSSFCWKGCSSESDTSGSTFQSNHVSCGAFCTSSYQECEQLQLKSDGLDVDFIERIYNRDSRKGGASMTQVIKEIQELYPDLSKGGDCYIRPESNIKSNTTDPFDIEDPFGDDDVIKPAKPIIKPDETTHPVYIDDDEDDGWGFMQ